MTGATERADVNARDGGSNLDGAAPLNLATRGAPRDHREMGQRTRLVFGSLAGAVAIHIMLVACAGSGSVVSGRDAAVGADGTADIPTFADVVDAVVAGDLGGALDAAKDAAVDALADLGSAETPDAHAGGNCQCIPPTETTFSYTVNRGAGAETPVARFSTASGSVTPGLSVAGVDGPAVYTVVGITTAYLRDGAKMLVQCSSIVSRAREVVGQPTCIILIYPPVGGTGTARGEATMAVTGFTVPTLENERFEFRALSATANFSGDAGTLTINNLVVRHSVPGGHLLEEPTPAYRP